jgi:hypothetical protein
MRQNIGDILPRVASNVRKVKCHLSSDSLCCAASAQRASVAGGIFLDVHPILPTRTETAIIMVANKGLIFKKALDAFPIIGEHLDLETRDFDVDIDITNGSLTVKNLFFLFNLYQRGCMRVLDSAT